MEMFTKNKVYNSNSNLSILPRNQSCYTFNNGSNNGTRFGVNRHQSLNSINAYQLRNDNYHSDFLEQMNTSYNVDHVEMPRRNDDEKSSTTASGLDPRLFQRQNSFYSIQNFRTNDPDQYDELDAQFYNLFENFQKEKQMLNDQIEKLTAKNDFLEAAFFEVRDQQVKCFETLRQKDQEIVYLKSIINLRESEMRHQVNQNETRKPLSFSSGLSLNPDDLFTVKSIDNAEDEAYLQTHKMERSKPTSSSTPNNVNNNNDVHATKLYKKTANNSLASTKLASKHIRQNKVENEEVEVEEEEEEDDELTKANKHSKKEPKYNSNANLETNNSDFDLLYRNRCLIETTISSKTKTTTKIKKIISSFVTNKFKPSKRNEKKAATTKRLVKSEPFKLKRAKTIEI